MKFPGTTTFIKKGTKEEQDKFIKKCLKALYPEKIKDDFIYCDLCGQHHYKNCHVKQQG